MLSQIGPELIERYIAEKVDERREGDARVARLEAALPSDRHKLGLGEAMGDGLPSWLTD